MTSKSTLLLASSEQLLLRGRKIVCIGRNYVEHANELGNPVPQQPFFFLKPTSSYIRPGSSHQQCIELPSATSNVHHEIELGVVIGGGGNNNKSPAKNISEEQAMQYVQGYVLALDLTERTLQNEAKKAGKPWTMSKGYDTFCPISDSIIVSPQTTLAPSTRLWCKVNGQLKQEATISDMVFAIPTLIAAISQVMTLEEHDVILTGTPHGVGPIVPGDVIEGGLVLENQDYDTLTMKFDVVVRGS
jgi:acylpyruvate hydrolase